jgi:hypothetical protein
VVATAVPARARMALSFDFDGNGIDDDAILNLTLVRQ